MELNFKQFLEVGKIVGTHGLCGDVKVESWCDSLKVFEDFRVLYFDCYGIDAQKVSNLKFTNKHVIIAFENFFSINLALGLVNKIVYANRDDFNLLPNQHFVQDLIGFSVINHQNLDEIYGVIINVLVYSANDVYEVAMKNGKRVLIPAIDDIIIKKDFNQKKMFIVPMEGLFDAQY